MLSNHKSIYRLISIEIGIMYNQRGDSVEQEPHKGKGGARPGAGRPRCKPSDKKKLRSFKATDREYQIIVEKAIVSGHKSISDYIRSKLLQD
jgi:hypothetical protein